MSPPPRGIVPKTAGEIDAMAASGIVLAEAHDALAAEVAVGVTTAHLDAVASICTSVNDQVVHGIPDGYVLRDGDVLSLDVGVILDGWVTDAARTHPVGTVSPLAARLNAATRRSLERGIAAARAGGHLGDIGHAVQAEVEAAGFSVVQSLVGHGVGRSMHEDPQVPNFTGVELPEGLVIAIEPMVNAGAHEVELGDDGWTITTKDGSLSAHWEHTVAVTADGPRILTAAS